MEGYFEHLDNSKYLIGPFRRRVISGPLLLHNVKKGWWYISHKNGSNSQRYNKATPLLCTYTTITIVVNLCHYRPYIVITVSYWTTQWRLILPHNTTNLQQTTLKAFSQNYRTIYKLSINERTIIYQNIKHCYKMRTCPLWAIVF